MNEGKKLNLNGEFLGVTALAVYSAPWFLQPLLIILVGLMFLSKVLEDSKGYIRKEKQQEATHEDEELEEVLSEVNRIFFGLTVARDDLPVYWMGTLIFVVTLLYSFFHFFEKAAELAS